MGPNGLDMFGWKAGLYQRLFIAVLPLSLFLMWASNTRTFGILLFFIGIPFFWRLRNREVDKYPTLMELEDDE